MIKKKFYLKIGKIDGRLKVSAHTKPNYRPFDNGYYTNKEYFPTIVVPVILKLPVDAFTTASHELNIKIDETKAALEIEKNNMMKK